MHNKKKKKMYYLNFQITNLTIQNIQHTIYKYISRDYLLIYL